MGSIGKVDENLLAEMAHVVATLDRLVFGEA